MRDVRILPYNINSESAQALAQAMGCLRINRDNTNMPSMSHKHVINWGCSNPYRFIGSHHTIYNQDTGFAVNKHLCFIALESNGVSIPEFTNDRFAATMWNCPVVVRHTVTGHSGQGLEIVDSGVLPPAPLYTKYIKKSDEYRVHVVRGEPILIQRKARRLDVPDEVVDWRVRNYGNGFTYALADNAPADVIAQAILAVQALTLDFGAVDVIYNTRQNRAYVLEVNTSPGLEGRTLERYAVALTAMIRGQDIREAILSLSAELPEEPVVQSIQEEEQAITLYAVKVNGNTDVQLIFKSPVEAEVCKDLMSFMGEIEIVEFTVAERSIADDQ